MIPSTELQIANVGNLTENVRMGIDQSAFAHIMSILTDLYSDPGLAVVREYSTNARDSHIAAGNPDPIKVTLPTHNNRTVKVQDFGLGLTLDEIRDVYSQYGASTKRSSNDVNGMLGLGCKSGLTFAASFTITAVKDGQRSIAVVTKDDDGVGAIKVLAVVPTTDPNGVTIEIPVPANKVSSLRDTAENFFRYWEPGTVDVKIDDREIALHRDQKDSAAQVWVTPDILATKAPNYGGASSRIVMGGVAYPHDFSFKGCLVTAWVPIGSVHFTPSREALHYTDKTKATLNKISDVISTDLATRILEVAEAGTTFEKNCVLYSWGGHVPGIKSLKGKVTTDPNRTFSVQIDRAVKFRSTTPNWPLFTERARWIVSGFPFKSVGHTHKRRLTEHLAPQNQYNETNALLFPPDTDLSALDGHPRLVSWETIVKNTTKPPAKKRTATVFTGLPVNGIHTVQFSDEQLNDRTTVLTYAVKYSQSGAPEARQVVLTNNAQVDRFKRLYPHAISVDEYLDAERKKANAALTDDDKLALTIRRGNFIGPFKDPAFKPHVRLIEDPLIRRVINLSDHQSATLTRAESLSVAVPADQTVSDLIESRYPLLKQFHGASSTVYGYNAKRTDLTPDIILYINAKFRSAHPT